MFNSLFGAEHVLRNKYKEKMTKVVKGEEPNPTYTWQNVGAVAAHTTVAIVTCVVIVKVTCVGLTKLLAD